MEAPCSASLERTRRQNHSEFGDPSGSLSNLRLAVPVELVALRAAQGFYL